MSDNERPRINPKSTPNDPPTAKPAPKPTARPVTTVARAPRAAEAPKKPPIALIAGIGGAVVVVALMLMLGGDDKPAEATPTETTAPKQPEAPKAPTFDAAARIAEMKKAAAPGASGQVASAKAFQSEAEAWKTKGAPSEAVTALRTAEADAWDEVLKLDKDNAEARAYRAEVKYGNELEAYSSARWMTTDERDAIRKTHLSMLEQASKEGGWVRKTDFERRVKPVVEKHAKDKAAWDDIEKSAYGKALKDVETSTQAALAKAFEGKVTFLATVQRPYVIFVEETPSWEALNVGKSVADPLLQLNRMFMDQYAKDCDLKPIDDPIPVVYFESDAKYRTYNAATGGPQTPGVLAHFEHESGRLVVHRQCDFTTIMHEGTHQLFAKHTRSAPAFLRRSYWFQEGVAEWFGGSSQKVGSDGAFTYEVGLLQVGRLEGMRSISVDDYFSVSELVQRTYGDRMMYESMGGKGQTKIQLIYAQGWFLIYFVNHFNVDAEGYVVYGKPGKYKAGWSKYLKSELDGKTGKKVFMEAFGVDDDGLKKMNEEFQAYYNYVMRKIQLDQVKDKQLIPWDAYVNRIGEKTGEKEDDILVPKKK